MRDSFYIAWRYLAYHRIRTLVVLAAVVLIASLPLALQILLEAAETQLMTRATNTPLLVGARGSVLDLVMNSLYFTGARPARLTLDAAERLKTTGLAVPVPLYARFDARGLPIVGTSVDYFSLRQLRIREGRAFAVLGETVLGADAAERLGLRPGAAVTSSPENAFDLAGIYPLKMKVVGVLAKSRTPDDLAVFVDLKTAWIVQGLGHGHQDLASGAGPDVILERTDRRVTANAKLVQFTEITPTNIDSFHFHGDVDSFPISAILAFPADPRSGTLLRGRYLGDDATEQVVVPREVIADLMHEIFRIKNLVDVVLIVAGVATMLLIVLVFTLSLRLRQRELQTVHRLGASRRTAFSLVTAELILMAVAGGMLVVAVDLMTRAAAPHLVRMMLVR